MIKDVSKHKSYAVLFVDDEEKALKYFDLAFRDDFWVITANNAAKAKQILGTHGDAIGVIITDQRMPEEKGATLLGFVRQNHPNIVRVLTTAYSDLDAAIDAINSGEVFCYITKPWNIPSLKNELLRSMNYFHARHERDLLQREKLSIWQRLVHVDRARDLIVTAGALSNFRHPLHAITLDPCTCVQ